VIFISILFVTVISFGRITNETEIPARVWKFREHRFMEIEIEGHLYIIALANPVQSIVHAAHCPCKQIKE